MLEPTKKTEKYISVKFKINYDVKSKEFSNIDLLKIAHDIIEKITYSDYFSLESCEYSNEFKKCVSLDYDFKAKPDFYFDVSFDCIFKVSDNLSEPDDKTIIANVLSEFTIPFEYRDFSFKFYKEKGENE